MALLLLGAHKWDILQSRITEMKNSVNEISQKISLGITPFEMYPVDIWVGTVQIFDFQNDGFRWKVFWGPSIHFLMAEIKLVRSTSL
jgi:hypothetical protein